MGPGESQTQSARARIPFEAAVEVFSDPNVVVIENYWVAEEGEQRYGAIGMMQKLTLLLVVFVDRSEPGLELIHIISARKAERYENKIYAAHIAH